MPVILSLIGKGNVFNCRNDKFVQDCMLLLTLLSRYHPHIHVIMLLFGISADYVADYQLFIGNKDLLP